MSSLATLAPPPIRRWVRAALLGLGALVLVPQFAAPAVARGQLSATDSETALRDEIAHRAGADLREFYATRGNRPLWLDASGQFSAAAELFLDQLDTAWADGLNPKRLLSGDTGRAFDRARNGSPENRARAELALSKAFANYVKALRQTSYSATIYESAALAPVVPTTTSALRAAADAPSLDRYVGAMGWMHPLYAPMRDTLVDWQLSDAQRAQVALNLQRVRAIPAYGSGRHVLIDAAGARLWMYDNGRVVDTMKVVVGKPEMPTPMMAGFLRYAIVNPYWNMPDDLVPSRITEKVLARGSGYVRASGYQILSGWEDDARVLDPAKVNWRAVAAGQQQIRVRQLPGAANFMGRVKFMFPNPQGIYLHDTPEREYLARDARQFSSGCVRLEDAARLGRWLMGAPLPRTGRTPEQRIELPEVVPVYITYFTALPENGRLTFRNDVYGRDRAVLAAR